MKKYILLFAIVISVFSFEKVHAQNTENAEGTLVESQERFITLSQLQNNAAEQVARENLAGNNAVFIQQIGSDNQVFSNITAQSSDIRIIQNGDQNLIDINENSSEIQKLITQNGNNNTIIDFSFNPNATTNLDIIQEGNNILFERFGSNELSNSLQFRITGNNRTVIVRGF